MSSNNPNSPILCRHCAHVLQVSHLLQKPIESVCGYLTVLPGAFSAFRWLAVEGEPLRRYFYGLYSQVGAGAGVSALY